jgi:uncharacterized protein
MDTQNSLFTSHRIHGAVMLVLIMLGVFLLVHSLIGLKEYRFVGSGIPAMNTITVSGGGEVFGVPDLATFTVHFEREDESVGAVQENLAKNADALTNTLKEAGIEERDIKTVHYNIAPKYQWIQNPECPLGRACPQERVQRGFSGHQELSIKVRESSEVGNILEMSASSEGVSNVSNVLFTIDDEDSLKEDARKEAIEHAKEKAKVLARDLGVSLVRVVSFNEGGSNDKIMPEMMMRTQALGMGGENESATPENAFPVGENTLRSLVTITYEIR